MGEDDAQSQCSHCIVMKQGKTGQSVLVILDSWRVYLPSIATFMRMDLLYLDKTEASRPHFVYPQFDLVFTVYGHVSHGFDDASVVKADWCHHHSKRDITFPGTIRLVTRPSHPQTRTHQSERPGHILLKCHSSSHSQC